jgi:hypothetical protein
MRELKPYQTLQGLRTAIDNGGRFYNVLSHANDQVLTRGELAKAAGVFTAGMNAFLFLEMAQQELPSGDRQAVLQLLDTDLRKKYQRYKPLTLLPSAVEKEGFAGSSLMVTGYPQFVENRKNLKAFIVIPAGKVPILVPIFEKFDVYEVFDDLQMSKPGTMVATVRGQRLSHNGPIRFGGVLRKLKFKDETEKSHKFYLETLFYTKL